MAKQGGSGKNMQKMGEKKNAKKRKKGVKNPDPQNGKIGNTPLFWTPPKWGYPPRGEGGVPPPGGGVPPARDPPGGGGYPPI